MATAIRIRQVGNSAGIVLSKEMLDKLGVQIGSELQLIDTPEGLLLSAFDQELGDADAWIERGARKYKNTLRALSK